MSACAHLVIVGAGIILLLIGCTPLAEGERLFFVTTDRPDNRVYLLVADDTAYFTIESKTGIGEATVRWVAGPPIRRFVLRFHLRGLEGLRLVYGDTAVQLSLASVGDHQVIQTMTPAHDAGAEEFPLTADSPDWLHTQIVAEPGAVEPSLPLENGYIEVELPPRFLLERHTSFKIRWIDFYR